jgi:hypothetical protein
MLPDPEFRPERGATDSMTSAAVDMKTTSSDAEWSLLNNVRSD